LASYDDFDTSRFASGGEAPPITGGQWMTARIASAFDVPAHLVGGRVTPNWPDPTGGISAGSFIRHMVDDAGLAVGGLWDHDADNFLITNPLINPITKEYTTMQTKITIQVRKLAPTMLLPKGGDQADVTMTTDLEDPGKMGEVLDAARFGAAELARAMGIEPYEEPAVIAMEKPEPAFPTREHEDGEAQPDDDGPDAEERLRGRSEEEGFAMEEQRQRMHKVISDHAPTIEDVATKLLGPDGDGANVSQEDARLLGAGLRTIAADLAKSRLPLDTE
jgi:hypothetical protein